MHARRFAILTALFAAEAALANPRPFRVVIDPGHGGTDQGTVYSDGHIRVAEKDVTLLLARGVARKLKARGYRVYLTRRDDHEVPLGDRTALANRLKADLFLSIHMNSRPPGGFRESPDGPAGGPEGVETYILNNATDATSRRLAHLENSIIPRANDYSPEQMDVALILKDLRLDANLSESKRLACTIQRSVLSAEGSARDRGVKQAMFHVLLGADMPSALVEAGFLASPRDRAEVLSPRGQDSITGAIARAIASYKAQRGTQAALSVLSSCRVR